MRGPTLNVRACGCDAKHLLRAQLDTIAPNVKKLTLRNFRLHSEASTGVGVSVMDRPVLDTIECHDCVIGAEGAEVVKFTMLDPEKFSKGEVCAL